MLAESAAGDGGRGSPGPGLLAYSTFSWQEKVLRLLTLTRVKPARPVAGAIGAAAESRHDTQSEEAYVLATDYPFLDLMWTMVIFFVWILWIWLLFSVFADIFRRHDLSGLGKTGWIVFAILLPFLGVFVYLITQNVGMTERNLQRARARQEQRDAYVRQTAAGGGAAAEIDKAKQLLDSGAITQAEFEALKQKALA